MRGRKSDDKFYLKLFQKHGSIFKLFWGPGDLKVCLIGFARGRRLLRKHADVLRQVNTDISPVVPHGYLRGMRGELHTHYRRAFASAFGDDLIDASVNSLRNTVRSELTRLQESKVSASPAQSLTETLNRISTRSLLALLFGVESNSRKCGELYKLYCELGPNGYIEDVRENQTAIYANIRQVISEIELSIRRNCPSDAADSLLKRLVVANAYSGLDETTIGNTIYMIERGRHDLRDLLRWQVKYLSDNPSIVAELRTAANHVEGMPSLAQACVMETLRLDQAESVNRQAIEAFDFEGYHVPKNTWVAVLLRETHRDARVFDEPDRYRPRRFFERTYSANEYSPFGLDSHQCIAGSFVIQMSAMFVDELAKGFRWEVIGDGPRHWGLFHWQPAPSFAIRLTKG